MPKGIWNRPRPSIESRFWSKVDKSGDCWNWTKAIYINTGYGRFFVSRGKAVGAHRKAWELSKGPIPNGMNVLHHCDNRRCVNPSHLFIGTHSDNVHDKVSKNRCNTAGIHNSQSKLDDDKVRFIRASSLTHIALASMFGVSETIIWCVKNNKTWNHVV